MGSGVFCCIRTSDPYGDRKIPEETEVCLGRSGSTKNAARIKLEKKLRKKDALGRIPIEGKFGQGKNGYRLNYIRAKTAATYGAWTRTIFLVMHLMVLLRCWCCFNYNQNLAVFRRSVCFAAAWTGYMPWTDEIFSSF